MKKPFILSFLFMFIFTLNLTAARPFITDDAGTVSAGGYEFETGYEFWKNFGIINFGLKHGLTEKMDIGIGFGYNIFTETERGFQPSEFCLKFNFLQDILSASFSTEFNSLDYNLNVIFTKSLRPVEMNANVGWATSSSSVTFAVSTIYNLSSINFGSEVFGDKESTNWLFGLRYKIKDGLIFDIGFMSDFKLEEKISTIGLHYEF